MRRDPLEVGCAAVRRAGDFDAASWLAAAATVGFAVAPAEVVSFAIPRVFTAGMLELYPGARVLGAVSHLAAQCCGPCGNVGHRTDRKGFTR